MVIESAVKKLIIPTTHAKKYLLLLSMENDTFDCIYNEEEHYNEESLMFDKECDIFMKNFVSKIFSPRKDITQEEKANFGVLCQHSEARKWFSKHIDAQRVYCKSVDELTFFQLVQYFAVVLFECHQSDDFVPAKNLMNMCFTFFWECRTGKDVDLKREYLSSYLKEQPIWHSPRFWNAAFFDTIHGDKETILITSEVWESWTHQEQQDYEECDRNSTFGKLGTFLNNMKAFGINRDMCIDFLHKMSTIANLQPVVILVEQVKMLEETVV